MKTINRSLILAAAASGLGLMSTLSGFGQAGRFYTRGGVGAAVTENTDLKEFPGVGLPSGARVKFDTGFQLRFAGGFNITDWLATEVESGVTVNTIHSITGATEANGSLANAPLLANLVLQCPKKYRFAPYIGAGLGVSSALLDADDIVINGLALHGTQSEAVFAYHGFAGLRYHLNANMAVSVDYRFFATDDPTWKADFGIGSDRVHFGDIRTHSITAAFTFSF